jgi:serine/threonine protein kinase
MVTRRVAGGSLAETLRVRGPGSIAEVVAIGVQVGEALSALHARGILHRDVKPSNVVVSETAVGIRATLVDLGTVFVIGISFKYSVVEALRPSGRQLDECGLRSIEVLSECNPKSAAPHSVEHDQRQGIIGKMLFRRVLARGGIRRFADTLKKYGEVANTVPVQIGSDIVRHEVLAEALPHVLQIIVIDRVFRAKAVLLIL